MQVRRIFEIGKAQGTVLSTLQQAVWADNIVWLENISTRIGMPIVMRTDTCADMCIGMHVHMNIGTRTCVHIGMCVHLCVDTCTDVCR